MFFHTVALRATFSYQKGSPMIAVAKPRKRKSRAGVHTAMFLELLPRIREQAGQAFGNERGERRQELIAEVIANCWVAFVRLIDRGLDDVVYATPLAQFAIKQVRDGRRVGCKSNCNDLTSPYCRRRRPIVLERLDRYDEQNATWQEVLIEDRHAGPADTAACRIDFGEWLQSLPRRSRKIAERLAIGETTGSVARKFRLTSGRVSQMRREFKSNWEEFQGEAAVAQSSPSRST